jgi:hypothetical protein
MKSLCNSHEIREILIFIIKKEIGIYTHNLSFIESKDFKDFVGIAEGFHQDFTGFHGFRNSPLWVSFLWPCVPFPPCFTSWGTPLGSYMSSRFSSLGPRGSCDLPLDHLGKTLARGWTFFVSSGLLRCPWAAAGWGCNIIANGSVLFRALSQNGLSHIYIYIYFFFFF